MSDIPATLSDKTWVYILTGLGGLAVCLMGGQIDYGIRANALTRTALPGEAQAPAGLGPDGRVSTFAGEQP